MKISQLMDLIAKEEQQRSLDTPKIKVSKNVLRSLLFYGLRDGDIVNIILPKIVDWEFNGDFSKEKLKIFITQYDGIRILPSPIRFTANESIEQRRMDSLSRLLSLDNKYTPCVAVTFYKGRILASLNSPNPKEAMTESELIECLARKVELIQNFLLQLAKNITLESQPNLIKMQFFNRTKLLAQDTILKIISPKNGGVGDIIPNNNKSRHNNREDLISHLSNALLKLAQHYLLGIYTHGKKGFNLSKLDTLLKADMMVITPNTAVLQRQQMHAEQAILYYLKEYTDFNQEPFKENKINIGISKLCCQACHDVLSRQNDKVSHRGSHGMNFPNVYDIDKKAFYKGEETKLEADLCPSDSESECDFFSDEESDPENERFTFKGPTTGEPELTVMKKTAKSRFFKACSVEPNADDEPRNLNHKVRFNENLD